MALGPEWVSGMADYGRVTAQQMQILSRTLQVMNSLMRGHLDTRINESAGIASSGDVAADFDIAQGLGTVIDFSA